MSGSGTRSAGSNCRSGRDTPCHRMAVSGGGESIACVVAMADKLFREANRMTGCDARPNHTMDLTPQRRRRRS